MAAPAVEKWDHIFFAFWKSQNLSLKNSPGPRIILKFKIIYVYVKLKRSHFVGTELWPDPQTRENFWSFKTNPSLLGANLTEIRAFEVRAVTSIFHKGGLIDTRGGP